MRWTALALFGLAAAFIAALVVSFVAGSGGGAPPARAAQVTPTWTVDVDPEAPRVGEQFTLHVTADGLTSPVMFAFLSLDQPAPPVIQSEGVATEYQGATWTFTALAEGSATINAFLRYEKWWCGGAGGAAGETVAPTPTCTPAPNMYNVPAPPVKVEVLPAKQAGDVDCDGEVNSLDALLVLQYGASLTDSLPCPGSGHMNGDCVTDALDAAIILQVVAGLTAQPEKPIC